MIINYNQKLQEMTAVTTTKLIVMFFCIICVFLVIFLHPKRAKLGPKLIAFDYNVNKVLQVMLHMTQKQE